MSNQGQPHTAALVTGFSLRQLAQGLGSLEMEGADDVMIMGICDDSRQAKPGYAMLCLPRAATRADSFAESAANQGATAIISVGMSVKTALPQLHLESMQQAGTLLRRLFKTEQAGAHLYGVTGTDGKTSVAWMLREALTRYQSRPVWSTGTLGWMRSPDDICDIDRKSTRLNSSHVKRSRMPSSA